MSAACGCVRCLVSVNASVLYRDVADVFAHTLLIFEIDHSCRCRNTSDIAQRARVLRILCVSKPKCHRHRTLNRSFQFAWQRRCRCSLAQIMHMMSIWVCPPASCLGRLRCQRARSIISENSLLNGVRVNGGHRHRAELCVDGLHKDDQMFVVIRICQRETNQI